MSESKRIIVFGKDITDAVATLRIDADTSPPTVRAVVEVPVDPDWLSVCSEPSGCEVFGRDHCGYWMHGREHSSTRGWLCWEHDDEHDPHERDFDAEAVDGSPVYEPLPGEAEARACWEAGLPMPAGGRWHVLDRDAACRAFAFGVAVKGVDWFQGGDATDYDVVIQLALLSEIRYG